jgi:hypothetical protein
MLPSARDRHSHHQKGFEQVLYIAHRINTTQQLNQVPSHYGIEIDLRDLGERLVLQHDPFLKPTAEDFEHFLESYHHELIILNVKSERIESRVQEIMQRFKIENYFFLDSSFPMIRLLSAQGERRLAIRFSELEPLEYALAMAGKVDWVWIDCFTHLPLTAQNYDVLKAHFKLCVVSPELQGYSTERIADFAQQLRPFEIDAVCTKRPDLWQECRANCMSLS